MRVIEPSVHVERFDPVALMRGIEKKGRLCYKSEPTSPTSLFFFLRTHLPALFDDIPNVLSTCPAKHFAKVYWEDA